jgi:hypothetical protein
LKHCCNELTVEPTSSKEPRPFAGPIGVSTEANLETPPDPRVNQRAGGSYRKLIRPLLLSVVCLIVLLSLIRIDTDRIRAMFARVDVLFLLSLAACEGVAQLLRCWRLKVLMVERLATMNLFQAMCLHQFYGFFLPFGLGRLSLPFLLKSHNIRRAQAFGTLTMMHLFDLAVLTVLLCLSLICFQTILPLPMHRLWYVSAVSGGALVIAQILLWLGPSAVRLLGQRASSKSREWVTGRLHDFTSVWASVRWRQVVVGCGLTVAIWVSASAYTFLLARQLVPALDSRLVIVLCFSMPLVSLLPIRGIAGLGTNQALIVIFFTMAGLTSSEALALSFISYPIRVGMAALFGVLGFLRNPFRRNRGNG